MSPLGQLLSRPRTKRASRRARLLDACAVFPSQESARHRDVQKTSVVPGAAAKQPFMSASASRNGMAIAASPVPLLSPSGLQIADSPSSQWCAGGGGGKKCRATEGEEVRWRVWGTCVCVRVRSAVPVLFGVVSNVRGWGGGDMCVRVCDCGQVLPESYNFVGNFYLCRSCHPAWLSSRGSSGEGGGGVCEERRQRGSRRGLCSVFGSRRQAFCFCCFRGGGCSYAIAIKGKE